MTPFTNRPQEEAPSTTKPMQSTNVATSGLIRPDCEAGHPTDTATKTQWTRKFPYAINQQPNAQIQSSPTLTSCDSTRCLDDGKAIRGNMSKLTPYTMGPECPHSASRGKTVGSMEDFAFKESVDFGEEDGITRNDFGSVGGYVEFDGGSNSNDDEEDGYELEEERIEDRFKINADLDYESDQPRADILYCCIKGEEAWKDNLPWISERLQKAIHEHYPMDQNRLLKETMEKQDDSLLFRIIFRYWNPESPPPLLRYYEETIIFYTTLLHPHLKSLLSGVDSRNASHENSEESFLNRQRKWGYLKDSGLMQIYLETAVRASVRQTNPRFVERWKKGLMRGNQIRLIQLVMEMLTKVMRGFIQKPGVHGSELIDTWPVEYEIDIARLALVNTNQYLSFFAQERFRSERLEKLLLKYIDEDGVNMDVVRGVETASIDLCILRGRIGPGLMSSSEQELYIKRRGLEKTLSCERREPDWIQVTENY